MSIRTLVSVILYIAVCTLLVTAMQAAATVGTIPLFGSPRILCVYCLASIACAWLTIKRTIALHNWKAMVASVGIGCMVAFLLPILSVVLAQHDANYTIRGIIRSVVAMLLVAPVPAMLIVGRWKSKESSKDRLGHSELILAILCAVLLPAVYVQSQTQNLRELCLAQAGKGRIASELTLATRLLELHGDELIANRRLNATIRELNRQYRELANEAAKTLPSNATLNERKQRAMQLLSIDRPMQAEQLLAEHSGDDPGALLLRALAARELKRWDKVESFSWRLLLQAPTDRLAIEMQADALTARGSFNDAIALYEMLLGSGGSADASIHFRLSKLLMDRGDRQNALAHLRDARRLDSSLSLQVLHYERSIVQSNCGLYR